MRSYRPYLYLRLLLIYGVAALILLELVMLPQPSNAQTLVNLDHLRFLTEPITVDQREMAIVHIYSEYPNYKWVDAAGEGISAVDDVARAAIVYLHEYERTSDPVMLALARRGLEFVRYMQAPDGQFYNFVINRSGKINQNGNTSYKSLTWWAMRGLWALGEGVRVFDKVDRVYADQLTASFQLTETAIDKMMSNYGETKQLHGYTIPAWLPNDAADSSSIAVLGLAAYYTVHPNPKTADILTKIASGVAAYHLGNSYAYPFGMHPVSTSAPGYWHDWGAHMVHALAVAGMTLHRQDWIESAQADGDSFLLRQLAFERFRDIGNVPNRLGQIAYGTNQIVQGYMALYRATGNEKYARYGGLAASWLFGNNMAGVQMYDPQTGRVLDGINGPVPSRVNQNAGAESTIEGLMSLQAVVDVPLAAQYLYVKPISASPWIIAEAEEGKRLNSTPLYFGGNWTGESTISAGRYVGLAKGDAMELSIDVEKPNDYLIYVAHLRQARKVEDNTARAIRIVTPPTIDGNLDDAEGWNTIPAINANSRNQFLRGASLWQGPDVDSHSIRLAWDQDNLYMGVSVRAPQYVQHYTLDNVWHDDAFWVYLSTGPDAQSLSSKFTLAQTPQGPQVWDWIHSGFVKGAKLAWRAVEGGYIYEASLPWKSLGIESKADMKIGLDAGRSIGGNSFLDLTGRDPDIVANLLPVILSNPADASAANAAASDPVVLKLQLDNSASTVLEESISPDRDYFWLDLAWKSPIFLSKGIHTLRYSFAGTGSGRSKIDAFYLQPAVARRTFRHPSGYTITLIYNTLTGEASWTEIF